MAATGRTAAGRALYARRKVMGEAVVGQIQEARGFRRFVLRGLAHLRGAWHLLCLPHNLLKMWRYAGAPITVEADPRVLDGLHMVLCRTNLSRALIVSRR